MKIPIPSIQNGTISGIYPHRQTAPKTYNKRHIDPGTAIWREVLPLELGNDDSEAYYEWLAWSEMFSDKRGERTVRVVGYIDGEEEVSTLESIYEYIDELQSWGS